MKPISFVKKKKARVSEYETSHKKRKKKLANTKRGERTYVKKKVYFIRYKPLKLLLFSVLQVYQ